MPKFQITKTIIQTVVIEVEEEDFETVNEKLYNGNYDDELLSAECEEVSERDSEYEIMELEEE